MIEFEISFNMEIKFNWKFSLSWNIFRSISNENKGFKMLSKLGWSEGQSLGKNNDGLLEPVSEHSKSISIKNGNISLNGAITSQIPLKMNEKKRGLGCESSGMSVVDINDPKQKQKARIWEKTHQRYHASEATVDIFKHCSDESD